MAEIMLTSNAEGAEEISKALRGVNVQTAKVHVGAAEHEETKQTELKDVEVGVFMDGTWNNRNNTDVRKEYEKLENGTDPKDVNMKVAGNYINYINDDVKSFENDYSNVARMYPHYKEESNENLVTYRIYVEGVGTQDNEKDTKMGGMFGIGSAGIPRKMERACEMVVGKIKVKEINNITIDVFGFSRGAAAARNFVHEITKPSRHTRDKTQSKQPRYGYLGKMLEEEDISLRMLTVRFIGLYDTVSSYGLDLILDIDDDTEELHLDAVRKARHTLQLTAIDEHRDNFALTNIKSARSIGKGEEYSLPGAHADVGGCYEDNEEEIKILPNTEREYVLEQGWYTRDQITNFRPLSGVSPFVKGKRTLPNTYSHIPLAVMADKMIEDKIPLKSIRLKRDYPIPEDLIKVRNRIHDYVFNGGPPLEFTPLEKLKKEIEYGRIDWPAYRQRLSDSVMLKNLRNKYLHFSAGPNLVDYPSRSFNGRRKREIIDG